MKPLPRRPLTGLAIFFIAGTGLGLTVPVSAAALLTASGTCLATAILLHGSERTPLRLIVTIMLLLCVLGLGWINAQPGATAQERGIPALVRLPTGAGMIGIITDEPVCESKRNGKSTWKFPIEAEQVRASWSNEWLTASGTVRARLFATDTDRIPSYGERWRFSGYVAQTVFKQGRSKGKPGGVFITGSARKARWLNDDNGNTLVARCLQWRNWAGRYLSQGITDHPDQVRILNSILLGYYSQIPRDLYQAFANTGTLHVFAISGSQMLII